MESKKNCPCEWKKKILMKTDGNSPTERKKKIPCKISRQKWMAKIAPMERLRNCSHAISTSQKNDTKMAKTKQLWVCIKVGFVSFLIFL
jgi:hypothetical protein